MCIHPIGWGKPIEAIFPMEICGWKDKMLASGKQVSIVRRFFFEKLGIKPNYNSRHKLAVLFQLLLYMFGNKMSAEEASSQLKITLPDALVASADTLLGRLNETNEHAIQKAFDSCTRRLTKALAKEKCMVSIDYHDIPYYGDKNDLHVRGTINQRGTNYCHQYATLEISDGEHRLTLAVKPPLVIVDEKALVIKELITIARKHIQIGIILLDRGFYNTACIRMLKELRFLFIMPVVKDPLMKRIMKENSTSIPCTLPYT